MLKKDLFAYTEVPETESHRKSPLCVGTLLYTRNGLLMTFAVLCLTSGLFSTLALMFNNAIPVLLRKFDASNQLIAVMMTTIPYVLNIFITPVVSFRSDRLRTRMGRRMPFLMLSAPFLTGFLVLIGWTREIGEALAGLFPGLPGCATLVVLGVFIVMYQIFYLILNSIIYYLFPDVIPEKYFGRFMATMQVTGSLIGFLYSRYFLKYIDLHLNWFFTGLGIAILLCFALLFRSVREGEYPPPEDNPKKGGLADAVRTYVKECYSMPFYYAFFLMMGLSDVSMICRSMFNLLYARETLGMSFADYGVIMSWGGLIGVVLSYPVGFLIDRLNALYVFASGLILVIAVNLAGFFLVSGYRSFYAISLLLAVVYTVQMTSTIPVFVKILPKKLFGQFSSANALFRALIMAVAGYGGGILFDLLKNYQYIFLWDFLFTFAALMCFLKLFHDWKKLGGEESYVPPVASDFTPQKLR